MTDQLLGPSAFTLASHVVLLVALVMTVWRVGAAVERQAAETTCNHEIMIAVLAAFAAIAVERVYYIAARALKPTNGLDLWALHPAPEMLSLMVAGAVYTGGAIALPVGRRRRRVALEIACMGALWLAIGWGLN